MARKKKEEVSDKVPVSFSNGDKAVFVKGRLVRDGDLVTAEEMTALIELGVVNG